jgi:hypothetical protein
MIRVEMRVVVPGTKPEDALVGGATYRAGRAGSANDAAADAAMMSPGKATKLLIACKHRALACMIVRLPKGLGKPTHRPLLLGKVGVLLVPGRHLRAGIPAASSLSSMKAVCSFSSFFVRGVNGRGVSEEDLRRTLSLRKRGPHRVNFLLRLRKVMMRLPRGFYDISPIVDGRFSGHVVVKAVVRR